MSRLARYSKIIVLATVPVMVTACRTARIKNPDPISAKVSKDVMRRAVLSACDAQSWVVTKETPGVVHATRLVRGRHELTVAINYDNEGVRIQYENSKGLKYRKGSSGREYMHKNGMVWMNELRWAIEKKLSAAVLDSSAP